MRVKSTDAVRQPHKVLRNPEAAEAGTSSPFWVIVRKEIADHIRSLRLGILLGIVALACLGSIYAALTGLRSGNTQTDTFLFLRIFTATDGTLPSFVTFVSFLGPLIGIALGFDAINAERNKGTLSRMLSQPIYRDDFIRAKFTASLLLIAVVMFALGLLVMGLGLITIGYPPTPEEFVRIVLFLLIAIVFIAFWLATAILCSIRFRQAATSALLCIAIWLFFAIFFSMLMNLASNATAPADTAPVADLLRHHQLFSLISRLSPAQLLSEATTTLLMPEVRTLGLMTVEQAYLAIATPLPLGQSILLVWPQLTGLLAATIICFGLCYGWFMRQEIRSRS